MKQREIKFRVWDNVDHMSKPFTLHGLMGSDRTEFTSDCVVMQFTSLRDKNGKEIYEGDVFDSGVKRGSDVSPILYSVKWNEDEAAFGMDQLGPFCLTGGIDLAKVVVIGNIYENPELLK